MTIDNLRCEFREIIQILNDVKTKFDSINVKIKKLKDVYDDLTNTNHDPIYIFGLDFLNFQYKIFHTQYKNLIDMIKLINNRVYGDYYKLCDLIINYVKEKIDDKLILASIQSEDTELPIYKDLNEYVDYSSETLLGVNVKVLSMLKKLNSFCLDKDKISEKHMKLSQSGFFLDNFLHSFETNNNITKNQVDLYVKNIEFFNKNHKMMLTNIYDKICDLYNEMVGNIEFEDDDNGIINEINEENSLENNFINNEFIISGDNEEDDNDENGQQNKIVEKIVFD